jgi:hypothetical protein
LTALIALAGNRQASSGRLDDHRAAAASATQQTSRSSLA